MCYYYHWAHLAWHVGVVDPWVLNRMRPLTSFLPQFIQQAPCGLVNASQGGWDVSRAPAWFLCTLQPRRVVSSTIEYHQLVIVGNREECKILYGFGNLGPPWPATPKELSHAYHWAICVVTQGRQEQQHLDLRCVFLLTPFTLCFLIDLESSFHVVFSWILLWVNPSCLSHPT